MAEKALNYRDEIASEIIKRIEAGTAPWQKPWEPGTLGAAPFNPVSGKPYRGINDMWLSMRGFADPRWMTYRQAGEAGAQVRKGERSTTIEYWQWSERVAAKDEDGKPTLDGDGNPQYVVTRLERPRVFFAKVFNAGQIDGLAPWVAPAPSFDPVARAEAIIAGAGVVLLHDQADRAFYRPMTDDIHLPPRASFKGAADYYGTALHELGHATGHGSRLDRAFGPFGSEGYAREELRAEIASYMLARDLGIGFEPGNHAAYVAGWLKALREDRNEIFHAARDAEVIKTWVMEPEQRQALEQTAKTRSAGKATAEDRDIAEPVLARAYLSVPYAERDAAKAAGARWDREAKSWYMPEGADPAAFSPWVAASKEAAAPSAKAESSVLSAEEYTRQINAALDRLPVSWTARRALYEAHCAYDGREREANWGSLDLSAGRFGTVFHEAGLPEDVVATLIERAGIAANWPRKAAEAMGLACDPAEITGLTLELPNLDWTYDHSDDPALRSQESRRITAVRNLTARIIGTSRAHAELVSVVWDKLAPKDDRRAAPPFADYIPAGQRTHDLVVKLAADPVATMLAVHGLPAEFTRKSQTENQAMATPRQARVYLAVPYAEKDAAKAAGARWDRNAKSWYMPNGADPAPFAAWAKEAGKAAEPSVSPVEEFAEALKTHGLRVEGVPVMDGQWHRVAVEGDRKGQMSGSYRGFLDGRPCGQITNYKAGEAAVKWVATGVALTDEARAQIRAEAADVAARRETDRLKAAEAAAKVAYGVWKNLPAAATPDNCPYLKTKGVWGHGVKVDAEGALVVPARDPAGRLSTIQVVRHGAKLFLKESAKQGMMHVVETTGRGTLAAISASPATTIVIAEGYATAATLHEASARPVVVAFDSGNLLAVAQAVRAAYPERDILIAADNDHANKLGNVGIRKATEAAEAVGATVLAPEFTPAEKAKGLTDFNDLAAARGRSVVLRAVEAAEVSVNRHRDRALQRSVA